MDQTEPFSKKRLVGPPKKSPFNGGSESDEVANECHTQAAAEPLNSTLYRPRLKAVAPITKTRAVLKKAGLFMR